MSRAFELSSSLTTKANFLPELQSLKDTSSWRIAVDFDAVETSQLSLLERARLFVKLRHSNGMEAKSSAKAMCNEIKFKTVRNTMISEAVLPAKSQLIKVSKEVYSMDHTKL